MNNSFKVGFLKAAAAKGITRDQAEFLFKNAGVLDELKALVKTPGQADMANAALNTPQFGPEVRTNVYENAMGAGKALGLGSTGLGMGAGALGGYGLGALSGLLTDDPEKKKSRRNTGALLGGALGGLTGGAMGGQMSGLLGAGGMDQNYQNGLSSMFKSVPGFNQ
mgnify:CR=1 FL=1